MSKIPPELATADAMAEFFMLCLDDDSPLDDWYQTLDPVIRTDWDRLEPEFVKEWAQPAELLNHKLKPEGVGTKVLFRRATQHAHIAWTQEMMVRVRYCILEGESRVEHIYHVGRTPKLSLSHKQHRPSLYTNWSTFILDTVMAINVNQLKEQARWNGNSWRRFVS
ncbi:hypothetical protein BGW80DRAFT_376223 [Lactifluus volemus]|nr:hypothetical protein BGW80DRAFT_376223 [Lactifluus volemus]